MSQTARKPEITKKQLLGMIRAFLDVNPVAVSDDGHGYRCHHCGGLAHSEYAPFSIAWNVDHQADCIYLLAKHWFGKSK